MRVPVIAMNSSTDTCVMLPLPEDWKSSLPGLARAYSTSSRTERIGSEGCTTTISGETPIMPTGARSRSTS
jgi:hypothetical protein